MEKEFLEYIVEHAKEIVFGFGSNGMLRYANQSMKNALEYDCMEGMSLEDIFPNILMNLGCDTYGEVGEKKEVSLMAYRSNRTCFRCEGNFYRMSDADLFVGIFEDYSTKDILEKKIVQVQQEAEAAMKVKSEFVANVTHELRTPVNGILGNTRILLETEKEGPACKTLRLIERGCNDMHSIINNILDFSKLEAGKFVLEERKFDFRAMIDYIKSNHMPKITEKGLQFLVSVSPEIPEHIIGDELRITQVLNNLLSNACKFTSFGKVSLEVLKTAQTGNMVELFFVVVDTGIGIDKADQDKLFQSFSQVDASVFRKYGGTGLGLNISQQLIHLMNGNISVESEKNKGTMFSFSIWVEVPEDEIKDDAVVEVSSQPSFVSDAAEEPLHDVMKFGTKDNLEEIQNKLSKLILCVEMDNWEKAEMFVEALRQLTADAPKEIKTPMLKLKMSVQKGDYNATAEAHSLLLEALQTR